MDTILKTVNDNLCISCGICAANCPANCITMERKGSQYLPQVNLNECVKCGVCRKVCPSSKFYEYDGKLKIEDYLLGEYKAIYCAKTKDKKVLRQATSGGAITQIILNLLEHGEYDSAFLLSGYGCDELLETRRFVKGDDFNSTFKSRYLTVSHENSIKYLIKHPDEKVILVATGCVVRGILNTIKHRKLNRDNYLIIGLFCDKTMHYGVVDYFSSHEINKERELKDLYFRTKDVNGWPGDVRLVYKDGSYQDLPAKERMKLKNYFMPERCLYCQDKLNLNCDIAVGDNYIKANSDADGVSSVIVRTERGRRLWEMYCKDTFSWHCDSASELSKAQLLSAKKLNHEFAQLRGLCPKANGGISTGTKKAFKAALNKIQIGKSENVYIAVNKDIKRRGYKSAIKKIMTFPKRLLKKF